jgi:hydrogenase expression/formation protein HypC
MCLAVPGRVDALERRDATLMAQVDFGGVRKDVCCEYVPDVGVGDYVIVHVGFAIQLLDEESALATLARFSSMGVLEEEFGDQVALAARHAGLDDTATKETQP